MPRPSPGKFVAKIDIYKEGGVRKIAKTMAVIGKKPSSGNSTIRWEIKNDTTSSVKVDLVNWAPRNPFVGAQPAKTVPANSTRQMIRNIANTSDRGTYTYDIKVNATVHVGDPWVIIF